MDRPITTLFMLMSLDGKISPGASDDLDVDKDFPKIAGLKEGHETVLGEQNLFFKDKTPVRIKKRIRFISMHDFYRKV